MRETRSLGFVELGRSYLDAATRLEADLTARTLRLRFDHPVDMLLAHAAELMLKGCILEADPDCDVGKYGHDLLRLYDDARTAETVGPLIVAAEAKVRDQWRGRLRAARDRLKATLGFDQPAGQEFGILDNAEIGAAMPDLALRKAVIWISARHANGGSRFRYLEPGLDQRPKIAAFGLQDDVVRRSLEWGCEAIHAAFAAHWCGEDKGT
jgi:hypothetical protein